MESLLFGDPPGRIRVCTAASMKWRGAWFQRRKRESAPRIEQERLNNVFGARLRITTLRARTGPGIELLECLAPRDGRPTPEEWRASDLAHWETTLQTSDLDETERRVRGSRTGVVSPGIVEVPKRRFGFARALVVRDPDRHVPRLAEP